MYENSITNKRTTPLRNSNSVNKPFRSPFSTVLTPRNNESEINENSITNKRTTPLRNSNSVNKPFRSPLSTVLTPRNNESPKNTLQQSPLAKSATPKRSLSQFRHPIKRRRIENIASDDLTHNDSEGNASRSDLLALKRRVRAKRQELERLKTKLNYIKKHKSMDLTAQIEKWRTGCKEALFQFHKLVRDKTSKPLTMREVLLQLGIPEKTVAFKPEECDLT